MRATYLFCVLQALGLQVYPSTLMRDEISFTLRNSYASSVIDQFWASSFSWRVNSWSLRVLSVYTFVSCTTLQRPRRAALKPLVIPSPTLLSSGKKVTKNDDIDELGAVDCNANLKLVQAPPEIVFLHVREYIGDSRGVVLSQQAESAISRRLWIVVGAHGQPVP